MFNPQTVDNFISDEENLRLLNFAKSVEEWESTGDGGYWDGRSLNDVVVYHKHDKEVGKLMHSLRLRIAEEIKLRYGVEEVYPDILQFVRWFDGMEMGVHSDDMENTPAHDHLGYRDFGCVIYLNDDYEGGHTFYPDSDFSVVPKAGTLAIHPGDTDHMHGVSKIEGNTRYTIASFWTKDESKANEWKPE